MNDFEQYLVKQTERDAAYTGYNLAGVRLELAQIKMRAAELISQHEPLASIGTDREEARKIISYILNGRF